VAAPCWAPTRGAPTTDEIFEIEFLHGILECPGRAAIFDGGAGLVLGNGDRGELRAVHAQEGDEIGARVDHGDVHRPPSFAGLGFRRVDERLRALRRDRRAVGIAEGHLLGNGIEIGRGGLLLGIEPGGCHRRRSDEQ